MEVRLKENSKAPAGTSVAQGYSVHDQVHARLPTCHGGFGLHYYENSLDDKEHLALVSVCGISDVLVRIIRIASPVTRLDRYVATAAITFRSQCMQSRTESWA